MPSTERAGIFNPAAPYLLAALFLIPAGWQGISIAKMLIPA